MEQAKKTLVLGASENPSRYSYMAIKKLTSHNHPVLAVGRKKGKVGDVQIYTDHVAQSDIDTVTLYLNPKNQVEYYDYILELRPKRIIFNPGTENEELMQKAVANGIEPVVACTLVMLGTNQY